VRLITSAFFTRGEYEAALDVLNAGAAEPRLLVSDTISLGDAPKRFEALRTRSHDCKILINPGD
jgi:(R,R)-butanediol dehydrogenase/meso-butanediol dehydrogenase/diacetyl reductase